MNDFDRRFKQVEDEFDKDWKRAKKLAWVIIMVMRYFGIV